MITDILGALAQICSANCSMRSVTSGSLAHVRDLQFELSSSTLSAKGRRVLQSLFMKNMWHLLKNVKCDTSIAQQHLWRWTVPFERYLLNVCPTPCIKRPIFVSFFCSLYNIFVGKNLDLACPLQEVRTLNMVGVLLLSREMLTEVGSNTFKQDLNDLMCASTCTNLCSLLFAHGCCKS